MDPAQLDPAYVPRVLAALVSNNQDMCKAMYSTKPCTSPMPPILTPPLSAPSQPSDWHKATKSEYTCKPDEYVGWRLKKGQLRVVYKRKQDGLYFDMDWVSDFATLSKKALVPRGRAKLSECPQGTVDPRVRDATLFPQCTLITFRGIT